MHDLTTSPAYNATMKAMQLPLQHFLDHGIFDQRIVLQNTKFEKTNGKTAYAAIPINSPAKLARQVAQELKRPFIWMDTVVARFEWVKTPNKGFRRQEVEREFLYGFVSIPAVKYLANHAAPFLAVTGGDRFNAYSCRTADASLPVVRQSIKKANYEFYVHDEVFWDDMLEFLMNDPDLRVARRAPPLNQPLEL